MAKKDQVEQTNETATEEQISSVASRTKRVNLSSSAPSAANEYTLTVSAEVIGKDVTISFVKQTPVVDEFWAQVFVKGITARFDTVVAGANGDADVIVEKLTKEVAALEAGQYATRTRGGAPKTDFINTVIAMAFVALFGEGTRVNEDNFQEVISNLDALQAADEAYQALSKEDKASAQAGYSKVASGISYFKAELVK